MYSRFCWSYCLEFTDKCVQKDLLYNTEKRLNAKKKLRCFSEKALSFFTSSDHTLITATFNSLAETAATDHRKKNLINMGYWSISQLGGKTGPTIPAPTHCLQSQSDVSEQDKETREVRNTLTEGLWQGKNRPIFFLFCAPDNVLRSAESTAAKRRHARCWEQKESGFTVISVGARSVAPHPPTSYRSAKEPDRGAQH